MRITVSVEGLKETQQWLDALAKGELRFGVAKGLTDLAGKARDEVVWDLPNRFTLRTAWWRPGSRYGFNIQKATKQSLEASIYTRAPWMQLQEEGGTKVVSGKRIAVPTAQVRRTKRSLIPQSQKPANLGNKAFKVTTKSGNTMLATRVGKGKRSELKMLYSLVPRAQVPPRLHFHRTVTEFVNKHGAQYLLRGIEYALKTAKR